MKTYVIADIHGRYDLLTAAFQKILAHADGGTIITLGDYIDRGPDSQGVIQFLMDWKKKGWRLVNLTGNHEEMMVEWYCRKYSFNDWAPNGGTQTMLSYGLNFGDAVTRDVIPIAHIKWLDKLPILHEDEHRVYVHAYVDETRNLSEQIRDNVLWRIWPEEYAGGYRGKHVVHGHEQFGDGPKNYGMRTDLDTFAWYTGRLVVGVFDDGKPGEPVEYLEVLGPSASPFQRRTNE